MRTYLTAVVVTAAIGQPGPVQGQDPALEATGIREYVSEVLSLNAAIATRRLGLRAATERIRPAGALPDPSVTTGMMSVPVTSFDFEAEAMTQLHLGLSQTFPSFGKRDARTALARADSAVSGADLDLVETEYAAVAARAFFDVAYARTVQVLWQDRLRLAAIGVTVAESRYGAGDASQTDVLRARLNRSRVEARLDEVAARVSATSARADALRGGTGLPLSPMPLTDAEGVPAFVPPAGALPGLDGIMARLPDTSPRMRLARHRAEKADRAARVLRIAARPDVSATLGTGFRFGGREPFLTAVVGIPLPLWAGRKQQPAARASALDAEAALRDLDDLLARTEADVRGTYAGLEATRLRIERTLTEILPLAEAASTSALSRYRVGGVDLTTVLETQDDLYDARLSLVRLIADYGSRRAEMAALIGEEWYR